MRRFGNSAESRFRHLAPTTTRLTVHQVQIVATKRRYPPPPALRCLDLKNGVSNGHLGFSEDFNKSTKKHKRQVVDIQIILFTYQAYAADGANVNSNKFHSVYKLLTQRRRDLICYLACRFRPQQCSVGLLGRSGRLRLS